jgi:hypothetical protein
MAQPGMQHVGTEANVKITIESTGIPNKPRVDVRNGQMIEFKSEPQTNQAWLVQFYDTDDQSLFPLTTYVPPAGGKAYVVVDYDGGPTVTVTYDVEAYPGPVQSADSLVGGGQYTITIDSGGRED